MVRQLEGLVANTVPVSTEGRSAGTAARAPRCRVLGEGLARQELGLSEQVSHFFPVPGSASLCPTECSVGKW